MNFVYIKSQPHLYGIKIVEMMVNMYEAWQSEKEREEAIRSSNLYSEYRQARRMDGVYKFVEYVIKTKYPDLPKQNADELIEYIVAKFYFAKGTSKIFDYLGNDSTATDYIAATEGSDYMLSEGQGESLLGLDRVGNYMYNGEELQIKFDIQTVAKFPNEAKFSELLLGFFKCLLFLSNTDGLSGSDGFYDDTEEGVALKLTGDLSIDFNYTSDAVVYKIIRVSAT